MAKGKPNFKLKALRVENQINQEQMSRILGISESSYNRKENGVMDFSLNECRKIVEELNADPIELFFADIVAKRTTKSA